MREKELSIDDIKIRFYNISIIDPFKIFSEKNYGEYVFSQNHIGVFFG